MNTHSLLMIGTEVWCNGKLDEIIDYVDHDSDEYRAGYRYVLRDEGTQCPEALDMA